MRATPPRVGDTNPDGRGVEVWLEMRRPEWVRLSQGAEPPLDLRSIDDVFDSGFDMKTGVASAAAAPILKESNLAPISNYAGSLAFRTLVNVYAQNRFFYRNHLIPHLPLISD